MPVPSTREGRGFPDNSGSVPQWKPDRLIRLFCLNTHSIPYVYIIQSEKDLSYYIGYSANPESRLIKHNKSNTGYTARKKPWRLLYTEEFTTKSEALKREKFIKAQKSRDFIEKLINGSAI